ncbi:MAG: murein hydrolase regulator LrgA [Neptuniibacter caesariensis]|uniref:Murein hydrolase regulator LrgA n=1 Tax=Neptuniibacter caesariensis TaxID=207954 RepID=A0A2G6JPT7_NEPCE|nr:MAG: murein hydrolase regulator LrgA [Neptuniibacter caesariensis]
MIQGFLILLLCQLVGELIVTLLEVPIPGSVVGMVVLLAGLMARGAVPEGLRMTGEGLLQVLPLLLVPAGVGLMRHFAVLSEYWAAFLIALFFSTLVTMLVVALLLKFLSKEKKTEGGGQ